MKTGVATNEIATDVGKEMGCALNEENPTVLGFSACNQANEGVWNHGYNTNKVAEEGDAPRVRSYEDRLQRTGRQ
jgi:hypothetical protein